MAIDPYAKCNLNIDSDLCTLQTCCLAQSSFLYIPSYGGNLFYAIFFGVAIIPQLALGIWYRTWGVAVGMFCGLTLEVIGYVSRMLLHNNPFDNNAFLIYLIVLTIAPVFFTAAIYLCLSRIIVIYGEHNSRFAPRTIALVFMCSDFISLVLQGAGGGIADTSNTRSQDNTGRDIMVAGLFLQVISLISFLLVSLDFAFRCRRPGTSLDDSAAKVRTRRRPAFKAFMVALMLAAVAILTRSIFRVIELWQGFGGKIWNNQIDFMVLDGAMVALAVVCLTAFHPGLAFDRQWHAANWTFRKQKTTLTPHPKHEGGRDFFTQDRR